MKELSGITGCAAKQIAKYEKKISNVYYPNSPSHYVERFCSKLNLKFEKTKLVLREIEVQNDLNKESNPIAIACAYIYKLLSGYIELNKLENVSGSPGQR